MSGLASCAPHFDFIPREGAPETDKPLCDNMAETSCVTAISEQGRNETQHGNDERFCSPGVTSSLTA